MKELSIEEKAKAYDGLVERLKDLKFTYRFSPLSDTIEEIFPELKESEDERIRKELLEHCKNQAKPYIQTGNKCPQIQSWITWLEKQGEQNYKIIKGKNYFCVKTHNYAGVEWIKGTKYYASDDYTLVNQGCECYCPEYSKEEHNNLFEEVKYDDCVEKQGEQKPIDKAKPKFKIGDWVVYCGKTYQITGLNNDTFTLTACDGSYFFNLVESTHEPIFHLWTIKDAKDGDVLVDEDNNIGIYKEKDDLDWQSYIYLGCDTHLYGFSIGGSHLINNTKPATKEQSDLLVSKMKEAGYTFDFEKKELKIIDEKQIKKNLQDNSFRRMFEKNLDWSKEDEIGLTNTIIMIKEVASNHYTKDSIKLVIDWLKSLKERIKGE